MSADWEIPPNNSAPLGPHWGRVIWRKPGEEIGPKLPVRKSEFLTSLSLSLQTELMVRSQNLPTQSHLQAKQVSVLISLQIYLRQIKVYPWKENKVYFHNLSTDSKMCMDELLF